MNDEQATVARKCLEAAYDGSASFPQIVGELMKAGFEGYAVDYRRNTTTYYLTDGDSLVAENQSSAHPVAAKFDAARVSAQIKWAQSGAPDYSYPAFCKQVKAAGCAGYLVSFSGRRVLYFGRTAETHVEHFPS